MKNASQLKSFPFPADSYQKSGEKKRRECFWTMGKMSAKFKFIFVLRVFLFITYVSALRNPESEKKFTRPEDPVRGPISQVLSKGPGTGVRPYHVIVRSLFSLACIGL